LELAKRKNLYWIRAQASPYPGAFTYYKGNKFTIDNVAFSSFKFDYNIPNGTILNENPIIVKTPNGALEILLYREKYQLIKEEILK
jgi:methionyl-tRNA formyltransferase